MNGWMDEIRLVNGFAVWTSSFAPPAGPYLVDVNEPRAPLYIGVREPPYHVQLRTWINSQLLGTIQVQNPFAQLDWPLPKSGKQITKSQKVEESKGQK